MYFQGITKLRCISLIQRKLLSSSVKGSIVPGLSFRLKNKRVTYQRLVDEIFKKQKGRNMEVYVDDLLVKNKSPTQHIKDLEEAFATLKKYM